MQAPATYLFVPADRPERFAKALAAGADRVILDLEDGVRPEAKPAAREAVLAARGFDWGRVLLRVNGPGTPDWAEDLRLLGRLPAGGVVVPKAEASEVLAEVRRAVGREVEILPQIETAAGLAAVDSLLAAPGVRRVALGHLDLAADLGCATDWEALLLARSTLVLRSRLAGALPPVEGVTVELDSEERLHEETTAALRLGFGAKLLIHPRQVEPVRRLMAPSEADVAWAERVLAAAAEGETGAVQLDGWMVDRPVVEAAWRTLARRARS